MYSSKISLLHRKLILKINFFCHHQSFFTYKNIFKVLQYLFNLFMLFNSKLLKIDQKCVLLKTWKKFGKISGNPVYRSNNFGLVVFIINSKVFFI